MNADEAWEEFKKKTQDFSQFQGIQKASTSVTDQLGIISAQNNQMLTRLDQLENKVEELSQAVTPDPMNGAEMGGGMMPPAGSPDMGGVPGGLGGPAPEMQQTEGTGEGEEDPNELLQALAGSGGMNKSANNTIKRLTLRSKTIAKASRTKAPKMQSVPGEAYSIPQDKTVFRTREAAIRYAVRKGYLKEGATDDEIDRVVMAEGNNFSPIPLVQYYDTRMAEGVPSAAGINLKFTPDHYDDPEEEDFRNRIKYACFKNAAKAYDSDPDVAFRNISALLLQKDKYAGLYQTIKHNWENGSLSDEDLVSMYHVLKDTLYKYSEALGGPVSLESVPMEATMINLEKLLKYHGMDNNSFLNEAWYGYPRTNVKRTNNGLGMKALSRGDLINNIDKFMNKYNNWDPEISPLDADNPATSQNFSFDLDPNSKTPISGIDSDDQAMGFIKFASYMNPDGVKYAFAKSFDPNVLTTIANWVVSGEEIPEALDKALTEATRTVDNKGILPNGENFSKFIDEDGDIVFSSMNKDQVLTWAKYASAEMPDAINKIGNQFGQDAITQMIFDMYTAGIKDRTDKNSPMPVLMRNMNIQLQHDVLPVLQNYYDARDITGELRRYLTDSEFVHGNKADPDKVRGVLSKFDNMINPGGKTDDPSEWYNNLLNTTQQHTAEYNDRMSSLNESIANVKAKVEQKQPLDADDVERLGVDTEKPTWEDIYEIEDDEVRDAVMQYFRTSDDNTRIRSDYSIFEDKALKANRVKDKIRSIANSRGTKSKWLKRWTESRPQEMDRMPYNMWFIKNLIQNAEDDRLKNGNITQDDAVLALREYNAIADKITRDYNRNVEEAKKQNPSLLESMEYKYHTQLEALADEIDRKYNGALSKATGYTGDTSKDFATGASEIFDKYYTPEFEELSNRVNSDEYRTEHLQPWQEARDKVLSEKDMPLNENLESIRKDLFDARRREDVLKRVIPHLTKLLEEYQAAIVDDPSDPRYSASKRARETIQNKVNEVGAELKKYSSELKDLKVKIKEKEGIIDNLTKQDLELANQRKMQRLAEFDAQHADDIADYRKYNDTMDQYWGEIADLRRKLKDDPKAQLHSMLTPELYDKYSDKASYYTPNGDIQYDNIPTDVANRINEEFGMETKGRKPFSYDPRYSTRGFVSDRAALDKPAQINGYTTDPEALEELRARNARNTLRRNLQSTYEVMPATGTKDSAPDFNIHADLMAAIPDDIKYKAANAAEGLRTGEYRGSVEQAVEDVARFLSYAAALQDMGHTPSNESEQNELNDMVDLIMPRTLYNNRVRDKVKGRPDVLNDENRVVSTESLLSNYFNAVKDPDTPSQLLRDKDATDPAKRFAELYFLGRQGGAFRLNKQLEKLLGGVAYGEIPNDFGDSVHNEYSYDTDKAYVDGILGSGITMDNFGRGTQKFVDDAHTKAIDDYFNSRNPRGRLNPSIRQLLQMMSRTGETGTGHLLTPEQVKLINDTLAKDRSMRFVSGMSSADRSRYEDYTNPSSGVAMTGDGIPLTEEQKDGMRMQLKYGTTASPVMDKNMYLPGKDGKKPVVDAETMLYDYIDDLLVPESMIGRKLNMYQTSGYTLPLSAKTLVDLGKQGRDEWRTLIKDLTEKDRFEIPDPTSEDPNDPVMIQAPSYIPISDNMQAILKGIALAMNTADSLEAEGKDVSDQAINITWNNGVPNAQPTITSIAYPEAKKVKRNVGIRDFDMDAETERIMSEYDRFGNELEKKHMELRDAALAKAWGVIVRYFGNEQDAKEAYSEMYYTPSEYWDNITADAAGLLLPGDGKTMFEKNPVLQKAIAEMIQKPYREQKHELEDQYIEAAKVADMKLDKLKDFAIRGYVIDDLPGDAANPASPAVPPTETPKSDTSDENESTDGDKSEVTETETPISNTSDNQDEGTETPFKRSASFETVSIRDMIRNRGVGNGVFKY